MDERYESQRKRKHTRRFVQINDYGRPLSIGSQQETEEGQHDGEAHNIDRRRVKWRELKIDGNGDLVHNAATPIHLPEQQSL